MSELGVSGDLFLALSSTVPVVAERSSYFDADIPGVGRVNGGNAAIGSAQGSTAWYFSEGHTGDGFHEYLVVANPSSSVADVDLEFSVDGKKVPVQVRLPPSTRRTLDVDALVGSGHDTATEVTSSVPVVAERPTYFRYHGNWDGGHSDTGATSPESSISFAEGFTG